MLLWLWCRPAAVALIGSLAGNLHMPVGVALKIKKKKRMYMCMCDWITLLYSGKLTEHCKPARMENIQIIFKNFKNGFNYECILCRLHMFFTVNDVHNFTYS